MRSPAIAKGEVGLTILWDTGNAARAYAQAVETATADILIFTHCDVYFPEFWFDRLASEVDRLTDMDKEWAVASISGVTPSGEWVGRIWDCSLEPVFQQTSGVFGKALTTPVPITSLDEMTFIVRRGADVNFDPALGFHLYGTDLILEAEQRDKRSYGLDLPVLHNAKPGLHFRRDLVASYKHMVRKWRHRLPITTPCCILTTNPFWLPLRRLRIRYKAIFRPSTYSSQRITDPHAKAAELGFDRPLTVPLPAADVMPSKARY